MQYPLVGDSRTAINRFTSEEKRALDRLHNDIYNEVRHAAEAHRQVCCEMCCQIGNIEYLVCLQMIQTFLEVGRI
jgi:hypothetical protein